MKRSSAGTYKTYAQASKRQRGYKRAPGRDASPKRPAARKGYTSVARTRGAAVTGEMKYFDCELNGVNITATTTTWPAGTMTDPGTTINLGSAAVATPLCLFAPTVGAALNQRIGRKVKVLKVKVHGTLNVVAQTAQSTCDPSCAIRLLLVQDMQTNAAQMTGAQLINDAGGAFTTLEAFQNPNNFGRFRVLKDKMFMFQNPNLAGSPTAGDVIQGSLRTKFKFVVNFKVPVECHFNATNGGTVADIVDNSFHLVCAADSVTLVPSLYYYSRVSYKE